jgi:tetratricopeptide (TPR) repeat protein
MRQSDFDSQSSVAADPAPALTRGTALGRFVVLGLVGRGGMGEVYAAYDPDLDRKIAIKLLRARAGESTDNRARLMREAKATAKISHPNVVVVYDAGTFGDRVFIAMEFVEGHTLRTWLQAQPRAWHEILDAFLAAGRGLAAAHDKELVHRDFKPDNVMVSAQDSQVRVMDFGLARIVAAREEDGPVIDFDATMELRGGLGPLAAVSPEISQEKLTATGAVLGTPAYMSPEQFRSQPADARSDQFSFCVALHEALFGDRPFAGRTLQELADNVVAGRIAAPPATRKVPSWIRKVLARGLSASPEGRFPTMSALLDELARQSGSGRTSFARGAAAKLAGVWEAPVGGAPVESPEKEGMRQAFLATGKPYAAAVFSTASAILDRFAQRWTELYVEVCEATHVRGEQSAEILDLRMACLEEGLDDLKALCRLFREATPQVVENAVKAADALGRLERCSDIKLLRSVIRPPEDAETRAAVEQLRSRIAEVRALHRVGRVAAGLETVAPIAAEARRVGYLPVLAEVLLVQGLLQIDNSQGGVNMNALEEAYSAAQIARHDEVAAMAAINLIFYSGYMRGHPEAGEVWVRCAEALLHRMGGHDQMWGWLFTTRAVLREQQGRLAEAIEDARRAIDAKTRAAGGANTDVAVSVNNLANHLAFSGDFQGAYDAILRAVEIGLSVVGPEHPLTAFHIGNRGQILYRLKRYDEAEKDVSAALAIMERETDPYGLFISFTLRTLGLCRLARGRFAEALPVLARAVEIRERVTANPLRLAEVHFPYARAIFEQRGRRDEAIALARRARDEYGRAAMTPVAARDLAELEVWLGKHAPAEPTASPPAPRARKAVPARRRAGKASPKTRRARTRAR